MLSRSTVFRILKKHSVKHSNAKNGHSTLLSESDRQYIACLITYNTFETAAQVQCYLEETSHAIVSVNTICRVLREAGLKVGKKRKVLFLHLHHHKACLTWAKKHANWTVEEWRQVIWSDKTKVNLFGSDRPKWCWKSHNHPLEQRVLDQKIKHGEGNIMLWGCMTYQSIGYTAYIYSTMDGEFYRSIIENKLECLIKYYGL